MSIKQPKNASPRRHVNSRSTNSPSPRSTLRSVPYETPPASSRYAHYVYNSYGSNRSVSSAQHHYRSGGFIRLDDQYNNENKDTDRQLVQQAALGQREIMYVSVAPACLGLACGLAMGTLGLIGCYKIDDVNRYSNIDFPDICIQAEETLLVKEYNIWNIIYNVFSIFQVGAFFGSLLTVCLRNVIGPKSLCQLSSFALFIGSITACIAKEQLFILSIVSKLTSSIGIGVCVVSVPIFVVESSTVKTRGSVCGLFQLCFFLGISISLFLKYRLYYDTINERQENKNRPDMMSNHPNVSLLWLFALGLQSVPSLVSFLFLCGTPESPRCTLWCAYACTSLFLVSLRTHYINSYFDIF